MREEKTLLNAVVVFPLALWDTEVLLGLKKEKIGAGCWNGYGGGIEEGETPVEAAIRECVEESGLVVDYCDLEKRALIDFHNQKSDGTFFTCRVHVYVAKNWREQPRETEEMACPTWFPIRRLPLDGMMPADREWLPLALSGKKVRGEVWYTPFQESLLYPSDLKEVTHLDEQ